MAVDSTLRSAWRMLLVLISGFALSQAFRTAAAIMAAPLTAAFGLTHQQLGLFAAAFHFSFAALQLFMGMGIDVYGVRRTVLVVSPLAIAGALVTAGAHGFGQLVAGQVLTGIGCAPAFLVCTVFIARRFPAERYAPVNGAALGIGSVGLLLTGTPLAWVIQAWGWRAGYIALAACAALAWLAIFLVVRDDSHRGEGERVHVLAALRGYGDLFRLPHTAGILALALFTYASFMSLRGLWLGPVLADRYGYTLVQSGNVALVLSALSVIGPPLFGRFDPGDLQRRRRWLVGCTLACAALFVVMALHVPGSVEVALALAIGLLSSYMVMQYADVRASYPAHMTGRAMAVFTMAMFMGVAIMQWLTGLAATAATALRIETYTSVFGAIAVFLLLGAALFRFLPGPQQSQSQP